MMVLCTALTSKCVISPFDMHALGHLHVSVMVVPVRPLTTSSTGISAAMGKKDSYFMIIIITMDNLLHYMYIEYDKPILFPTYYH